MKTIALIDGDIFAYEIAASVEEPINWGDGIWTLHSDENLAINKLDSRLTEVADAVEADEIIVCLSDKENWRYDVLPTYKSNRAQTRKPLLLKRLKEYIEENYTTHIWPKMEADDVLGILSTWDGLKGKKVIVTKDKDLLTIPGFHYIVHKEEHREVTHEEADRWHLTQALSGDVTDGYSGCPGIGDTTAAAIVNEPYGWESYEHEFKSGARKGLTETRWKKVPCDSLWEAVISQFNRAGLGEEEALIQARVARICRAEDYDFNNKEVILWTP